MLINHSLIHVEIHRALKPKANIIITPGIAQHVGQYQEVAKMLNKNGFNVCLYDVRGHGKSAGKRGWIKSIHDFTSDLHQVVEKIKADNDLKVFLLGHSMGGLITNLYALTYHDVAGVIISSAPTKSGLKPLTRLALHLFGFIRIKTNYQDPRLSSIQSSDEIDPYKLKSFTLKLTKEILITGIKAINQKITTFDTPILFFQGQKDQMVNPRDAFEFIDKLPLKDKELIKVEDGLHNLLSDRCTPLVVKDITTWINQRT